MSSDPLAWLDKHEPEPTPAPKAPSAFRWDLIIMLGMIIAGLYLFSNRDSIIPEPTPNVDPGKHVLILRKEGAVNPSQNSVKVQTRAKELGYDYRNFFPDDESWDNVEPVWRQLKALAKDPPSITIGKDGKARSYALPSTIQETVELIK